MHKIPLTQPQRELISEYYSLPFTRVILNKSERKNIWEDFKKDRRIVNYTSFENICPALFAELQKATSSGRNIQSAVLSECVYAQTLANQFNLNKFNNYLINKVWIDDDILSLIQSYGLYPRYLYRNNEGSRILIQAGGNNGVDSALISVSDKNIFSIEFKEPGAKTSEADLPKYREDGYLCITDKFSEKYPQFIGMVNEQIEKRMNFFESQGRNINDFEPYNVQVAVTDNYSGKKFADVICTEDDEGYLAMIPANQAYLWSNVQGEIRPAGRNPYRVWTKGKLLQYLHEKGAVISKDQVTMSVNNIIMSSPRGGTGISRYKINSLFFVRAENTKIIDDKVVFKFHDIWQLNPTISAKMFFSKLDTSKVKDYYIG